MTCKTLLGALLATLILLPSLATAEGPPGGDDRGPEDHRCWGITLPDGTDFYYLCNHEENGRSFTCVHKDGQISGSREGCIFWSPVIDFSREIATVMDAIYLAPVEDLANNS